MLTKTAILDGLTQSQKDGVTTNTDTLLLAGAGSGKTRVLTHRIAYLIVEEGVAPENILAITFTNKAANEMKERLEALIGEDAKKIVAGTFHSICYQWIAKYKKELGWGRKITIYDTDYSVKAFKWATQTDKNTANECMRQISSIKNKGYTPSAYEQKLTQEGAETGQHQLSQYYHQYQDEMKRRGAMDFDDLLLYAKVLLKNSLRAKRDLQSQFRYILCDEHQDTNDLQYQILTELKNPLMQYFFVGDDKQSIYSFRGANVENFLSFKQDFPAGKVIKLEENFRSTRVIVEAANELIKHNPSQMQMKCFSNTKSKHRIYQKGHDDQEKEAQWITSMIRNLHAKYNMSYNDIAIIYRTNAQSRKLEEQLIRMNIPYTIQGGLNFFQRAEIKDLLSFLHLLENPKDRAAMSRVMGVFPGLGDSAKAKVDRRAIGGNYLEGIKQLASEEKGAIKQLWDMYYRINSIYKIAEQKGQFAVHSILEFIIEDTKYQEKLKEKAQKDLRNYRKYMDKHENVDELVKLSLEYGERYKKIGATATLEDFLNEITIMLEKVAEQGQGDTVKLMTVHTSKGLEFRSVFVSGLMEETFPHKNSLPDPKQIEEERRLMYVAVTRAKELLVLSYAQQMLNRYNGKLKHVKPSRFLSEIPESFVKLI